MNSAKALSAPPTSVDLVTQTYHPLAKFAKDIAAGAVLIASINALAVAFLLFPGGARLQLLSKDVGLHSPGWPTVAAVTFLLLGIMVLMWKVALADGRHRPAPGRHSTPGTGLESPPVPSRLPRRPCSPAPRSGCSSAGCPG
jgi:hypothetical protein